jgi:hypothetical protein
MASGFQGIGKELFQHSQQEISTARGVLGELFPYIYATSSRMSTRAVSEWLCEKHNLRISHATIARALREAVQHISPIADHMFGLAEFLERETGIPGHFILYDPTGAPAVSEAFLEVETRLKELSPAAQRAVAELKETWYEYPLAFREACYKFLPEPVDEGEAFDAEDESHE